MNVRRLLFAVSVMLLGLCTAPACAEIPYSFTTGSTAILGLPGTSTVPDSATGLLFFAGIATIAGALEARRRTYLRGQGERP